MMKGLFNYESAYRTYTRLFLKDLVKENILYAEIRPNFMQSNQLFRDDGSGSIDNEGIMHIIIDVVSAFQAEQAARCCFFQGLKVIYCTPRVSEPCHVAASLDECQLQKAVARVDSRAAGFDLVGEEDKGRPLKDFSSELLAFKKCSLEHVDVPFLLPLWRDARGRHRHGRQPGRRAPPRSQAHRPRLRAGPSPAHHADDEGPRRLRRALSHFQRGPGPDAAHRRPRHVSAVGKQCALPRQLRQRNHIPIDPVSRLLPGHYGKADMDLFGWKQLVLWSMEHACLDESAKDTMMRRWEEQWDAFLRWIEAEYGDVLASLVCS